MIYSEGKLQSCLKLRNFQNPLIRIRQCTYKKYMYKKGLKLTTEHKYTKKGQIHQFNVGIYASKNVCVKDIGSWASMVLQNYQNFIEMTNMIYIVALSDDFKCPRKIHLNTQCPPGFR